jgi:hypothetical protein
LLSVLMETMTVSLNLLLMVFALMTTDAQAQESSALRMVQTIPLPNVEGRIDHMAIDLNGQRLFIAALKTIRLKYCV